jgi:hypothetical protein
LISRTHEKDAGVDPSNVGAPKVTTGGSVQIFGIAAEVSF